MEAISLLMDQLIEKQKEKLLKFSRNVIPHLTAEDILQPVDYPELENNPYFRYEEGILEGMYTVKAALLAHIRETETQ